MSSRKYYDDCAQILSEHILAMVKPAALRAFSTLDPLVTTSMNRADEDKKGTFLSRATRMLQGDREVGLQEATQLEREMSVWRELVRA